MANEACDSSEEPNPSPLDQVKQTTFRVYEKDVVFALPDLVEKDWVPQEVCVPQKNHKLHLPSFSLWKSDLVRASETNRKETHSGGYTGGHSWIKFVEDMRMMQRCERFGNYNRFVVLGGGSGIGLLAALD